MKILSITAQKPHSTGSGTYLTELVNSFDKLGHTQAVVAGIYRNDSVSLPRSVAFYPVYFDDDFPIFGMSDSMPYPSELYSEMDEAKLSRFEAMFKARISEAVEALDPDIIYCHHLFILTAIVREMYPDRFVCGQCHGSDLRQFRSCPRLEARVRHGISSLDKIYALHEVQAAEICELYKVPSSRIKVVGSGYNSALFNKDKRRIRRPGEPLRIIFAGKLSKAKGVPELLKAIRLLSDSHIDESFEVVLAGGCQDDEVLKELNSLIDYIGVSKGHCISLEYLGLLSQSRLASEFKKSDIFVLPSYFEGLGLVLIEAMASGLVPVATRLPGIKEWIDSHIDDSNAIYVDLPAMEMLDQPVTSELPAFVNRLAEGIQKAFALCRTDHAQPDTSRVSWDAIADIFTHK